MTKKPRIALLLRRTGPYHHARFNHAGKELDLHVVETRPGSEEYPWRREFANQESRIANRESIQNYNILSLPPSPDPEKGWRGRKLKKLIYDILAGIEPDIVVTTGWADAEYHAALLWAGKRNIPCAVISDSTETDVKRYRLLEWLKKQILKNYSAALVAGTRSRKYIEKLGMHSGRIFTAWDVVDNAYFYITSQKLKNDPYLKEKYPLPERYFLCVSRYVSKKNIPGLIRAYAAYIDNNNGNQTPSLVLLGNGEWKQKIDQVIEATGLKEKIFQFGFIQYDEIPYFYANAIAQILPSFYDQWGLVVNEAMACGLPVIVSENCGCVADLVDNGVNGLIVDPDDPGSLMEAMETMMDDEIRKKMGEQSSIKIKAWDLGTFTNGLKTIVQLYREGGMNNKYNRNLISGLFCYA